MAKWYSLNSIISSTVKTELFLILLFIHLFLYCHCMDSRILILLNGLQSITIIWCKSQLFSRSIFWAPRPEGSHSEPQNFELLMGELTYSGPCLYFSYFPECLLSLTKLHPSWEGVPAVFWNFSDAWYGERYQKHWLCSQGDPGFTQVTCSL